MSDTKISDGRIAATQERIDAYHPQPAELAFDVEAMLAVCVPGGSIVDPQVVADNIRAWAAELKPAELVEQQGDAMAAIGMGSHVIIDGCGATVIGLDPYTPRLEIEWDAPKGGKEYRSREGMTIAARQPRGR